jgi:hypothetical protein
MPITARSLRALPHPHIRPDPVGQFADQPPPAIRAPDHLMPPKIQASNAKHYKSDKALTEERDAA